MSDADTQTTIDHEAAEAAEASDAPAATGTGQGAAQRAGVAAQRAGEVLTDVAGNVASTVSKNAPAVIDASRSGAGFAAREVQGASSENLMLGTVFSTGLALGLLLARAPRLLVIAALVPVFVMGSTLMSRRAGGGPGTRHPSAGTSRKTPGG